MMNQEDIFKKIGQILNELNEQYQYLAQNPSELSELELELFMANASFLSDHAQIARKLNNQAIQKVLPEHTEDHHEKVVYEPVVKLTEVFDEPVAKPVIPEAIPAKPVLDEEIFKLDNETSSFEFILNERPSSDKFEFEEKSIDEIFDRPLSKEEEQIIAQKQKLREMDSLGISSLPEEEEEEGPEPFLVTKTIEPEPAEEPEPVKEEEFIAAAAVKIAAEEEQEAEPEEITEEPVLKIEEPLHTPEPIRFEAFVRQEEPVKQEPKAEPQQEEPKQEGPKAEPIVQKELFTPIAERVVPAPSQPIVKPTLNDILSGNSVARNLNTDSGRATITDLKQAISLNDKMRYIKDLFNGYNLAYAEAIDLVNKMPDFKTADAFLQNNYAIKHNWAAKQETADQFYELLNQRFPAAK